VLTAVVVHRARPDACVRTVTSLQAQGVERVIVVDNGSPFPPLVDAETVELGYNAGFGPAANTGLRRWLADGEGEWVLVCPHDAELEPGCVDALVGAASARPGAGLACAEYGDHHWSGTPVVDPLFGALLEPSSVEAGWEDAGYPHGTLLLARRSCLLDIGLFDERYFAYCEEADLGERARRAGWEVGIVRGAIVRNPGQSSASEVPQYLMLRNTLQLVRRHFGNAKAATQFGIVLGITARGALGGTKAPFWNLRGRWFGLRDALLGRTGAPPPQLTRVTTPAPATTRAS
jgi:N-acetylglucosaminyl-diphospho-decaprenol L-rhamnosyltransferase